MRIEHTRDVLRASQQMCIRDSLKRGHLLDAALVDLFELHGRFQDGHDAVSYTHLGHDGVEGGSRIGGLRDGAADDDVRLSLIHI